MKIQIIETDSEAIDLLKHVITEGKIADQINYCEDEEEAFLETKMFEPDIVLCGLVVGNQDGLTLIRNLKQILPDTKFIILSNVFSKEVIGRAYKDGAEYCVVKPLDYVEIESILLRVKEKIEIMVKLNQIKKLLSVSADENSADFYRNGQHKIEKAMQKLGILGESGCKDIAVVINRLIEEGKTMADYTLKEICEQFTDHPKTMEQRIRRAAAIGMVNIANLGIEDYMNETFIEYSNGIYNFEQIKLEMDYIRKKSSRRGMVNIKKFLDNLLYYTRE